MAYVQEYQFFTVTLPAILILLGPSAMIAVNLEDDY